jgi:hypothetical protein
MAVGISMYTIMLIFAGVVLPPGMDTQEGVSPRQITQYLERGDEPNIRTALAAMQRRGVTELVPASGPQRCRLAPPYRPVA